MELKVSTDPKIVKMFRRLEKFLDQEGLEGTESISMQNAETGRVFAVLLRPENWDKLFKLNLELAQELDRAQEAIDILEDDNALLALIDAQNDVLMGRSEPEPTEDSKFFDPQWFVGVEDDLDFPPAETAEGKAAGVFITEQEYEELINLRVKRARDKETITGLNATVKENKKGAETLQRQRDSYLAQLLEEKDRFENLVNDLFYENKITLNESRLFNGGIAIPGGDAYYNDATRDHAPRHAFTSDAIRDSDFFGYKPEDFR